ncbi:MAG: (2Fe-2S)-binding protein, partial [Candidatus Thermoplasmatota archaeon]|nr:(2Fe-2S)-binding protein [Candidatus Thermoplasmatota archaeon]
MGCPGHQKGFVRRYISGTANDHGIFSAVVQVSRITGHPVLEAEEFEEVGFTFNGRKLRGRKEEMVSSALIANDIHVFGHHYKDGSPQGIFCANGQCSQCLVIADGVPVKSCMTPLSEGMEVKSVEGLPELPSDDKVPAVGPIPTLDVEVLIIGGGPAGLSAAIELGKLGIDTLLIDDKDRLGGKLVLQTHKFFGSVEDS